MLYHILLYHILLYYIISYSIIFYSIVSYYITLHHVMLCQVLVYNASKGWRRFIASDFRGDGPPETDLKPTDAPINKARTIGDDLCYT